MSTEADVIPGPAKTRRFGWLQVLGIVLITILLTVLVTVWVVRAYIFPTEFKPVRLNSEEEQVLNAKLERLDELGTRRGQDSQQLEPSAPKPAALQPEAYSEEGAKRDIDFSERELNALLAKNTDLARKLAVDLSADLVSAKLLVPLDPDFPILGGKTLKVRAGVEVAYADGRPVVILKGVSIMGVPIPNAWLGGIKNIDLVREFGAEEGFWRAFAEGVQLIRVEEGRLKLELKE